MTDYGKLCESGADYTLAIAFRFYNTSLMHPETRRQALADVKSNSAAPLLFWRRLRDLKMRGRAPAS